ncbi:MAG TPA: hypothetical protein VE308_02000 [Nitrososphaera sp.]|jgi:hypothetical protein|nr:hypothetical protein [Nitrososphaera sp.]
MTTNSKHILSVGLAAATLLAVLPFFAGSVLLLQPSLGQLAARIGLVLGAGPAWFVPVVPISAIVLASGAFAVSWNQRSYLVAGLLAASGIIFTLAALIATGYFAVIAVPGPILGVIIGLGIFGLGVAKSIRTARAPVAAVYLRGGVLTDNKESLREAR